MQALFLLLVLMSNSFAQTENHGKFPVSVIEQIIHGNFCNERSYPVSIKQALQEKADFICNGGQFPAHDHAMGKIQITGLGTFADDGPCFYVTKRRHTLEFVCRW